MRIAHLNTLLSGGAGIAARRLHDSLVKDNIDSKFYYLEGDAPNNSYIKISEYKNLLTKIYKKLKRKVGQINLNYYLKDRPQGYELFSHPRLFYNTKLSMVGTQSHILHLHWISKFIDYPSFFRSIPDSLPLVWTLHDMNPFTGGCHYAWECERYKSNCCHCPQLNNSSADDLSYKNFLIKKKLLKNKNLHIVADSYWLQKEAESSTILSNVKSFQTIHYGLDTQAFIPKNKQNCQIALGIDPKSIVIGFGAESITNKRKGLDELFNALSSIASKDNNIVVISFGNGKAKIDNPYLTFKQLGFVESPNLLSLIYSASDIFIIPSLYEAFGQTALEAMACGTPVIGFNTGGIPDMVYPRKTGLLAKPQDSKDLGKQIQWMITHPEERKKMGLNARQLVEQKYTVEIQAEKYVALYKKLARLENTDSAE